MVTCKDFTWLNKLYFKDLIKKCNLPIIADSEIDYFTLEPTTEEGGNFSSVLMRVKITFVGGNFVSFIVKTIVTQEVANDVLVNQFNVHKKEMFVYGVAIREYEKILNNLETNSGQVAPVIYDVDNHNSAIILEDLSPKGYVVADRTQALDETHCKMTLEKLAKLHAASMSLNQKNPDIFKSFGIGMINRNIPLLHKYFLACIKVATAEIKTWHGFEEYVPMLKTLESDLIERACSVFDFKSEIDTFAFLHGDLWTTNIMFKYDKKNAPIDAVLIDFQMSSFGSPVIDLIYFIYTSAKEDIITEKTGDLLEFYHQCLVKTLHEINCTDLIPSLEKLQNEWKNKYFHAFISVFMFRTFMVYNGKADLATIMGTHEEAMKFKENLFKFEPNKNLLKKLLPIFKNNGIFSLIK